MGNWGLGIRDWEPRTGDWDPGDLRLGMGMGDAPIEPRNRSRERII